MEAEIRAILAPFTDAGCEFNGKYWEVWIGSEAGARVDGVSLAREIAARCGRQVAEPAPEEIPVFLQEPEPRVVHVPDPEQAARIAELEARLAKHEAVKPDAPIPDHLADLISYADTPAQTSEKLLVKLREVLGLIGLAEDDGGRAAPEMYRKRDRLESGIQWNKGRFSEQI
jgi:hypothetical protein